MSAHYQHTAAQHQHCPSLGTKKSGETEGQTVQPINVLNTALFVFRLPWWPSGFSTHLPTCRFFLLWS